MIKVSQLFIILFLVMTLVSCTDVALLPTLSTNNTKLLTSDLIATTEIKGLESTSTHTAEPTPEPPTPIPSPTPDLTATQEALNAEATITARSQQIEAVNSQNQEAAELMRPIIESILTNSYTGRYTDGQCEFQLTLTRETINSQVKLGSVEFQPQFLKGLSERLFGFMKFIDWFANGQPTTVEGIGDYQNALQVNLTKSKDQTEIYNPIGRSFCQLNEPMLVNVRDGDEGDASNISSGYINKIRLIVVSIEQHQQILKQIPNNSNVITSYGTKETTTTIWFEGTTMNIVQSREAKASAYEPIDVPGNTRPLWNMPPEAEPKHLMTSFTHHLYMLTTWVSVMVKPSEANEIWLDRNDSSRYLCGGSKDMTLMDACDDLGEQTFFMNP